MSSTKERIPVKDAERIAAAFIDHIQPFCKRVVIAGSIRRGLPTVGDIEIVAVPKVESLTTRDMFGNIVGTGEVDYLDAQMTALLDRGVVAKRPRSDGRFFWGPSAKYATFEGVNIDMFTPDAQRFGLILMIRTGPAAYSHQLVTERGKPLTVGFHPHSRRPITRIGMLPAHLRVQGGWLTSRVSGIRIPTPEERDFYDQTRLPYLEPWERL